MLSNLWRVLPVEEEIAQYQSLSFLTKPLAVGVHLLCHIRRTKTYLQVISKSSNISETKPKGY